MFGGGLAALLNASGSEVVREVGSGRELLEQVAPCRLDAAVVDIRMPPTYTEEGLDAADQLGVSHPEIAVLVLSTYAETAYAVRVFQHGAARRGYLLKDSLDRPEALRDALQRLCAGGSVLDASIVRRLMSSTRRKDALGALTDRQRQIVQLLAQGYDRAGIAAAIRLDEPSTALDIAAALRTLGIVFPEGTGASARGDVDAGPDGSDGTHGWAGSHGSGGFEGTAGSWEPVARQPEDRQPEDQRPEGRGSPAGGGPGRGATTLVDVLSWLRSDPMN